MVSAATSSSPPRRCGGVYFDLSIAGRAAPPECASSEGGGGDTQGEVDETKPVKALLATRYCALIARHAANVLLREKVCRLDLLLGSEP